MRKIFLAFLIFILVFGGVFATNPTIDGFSISPNISNSTTDVNASITSATNMDEFCLALTDSNINSTCIPATTHGDFGLTQFNLDLEEKLNTIYAFAKNEDGNYSTSLSANFTLDTTPPVIDTNIPSNPYFDSNTFDIEISYNDENPDTIRVNFDDKNYFDTTSIVISVDDLEDGTYEIFVDANDLAGNETKETITFYIDTTPPVINELTVDSGTSFTNNKTPTFTFDYTEVNPHQLYFTCDNNLPIDDWFVVSFSKTTNTFDITDETYECNASSETKTIYAKLIDKAGNLSEFAQVDVKYDVVNPNSPTNLVISSEEDRALVLEWTVPSAKSSGAANTGYIVFYETSAQSSPSEKTITTGNVESIGNNKVRYTLTGLQNNIEYTIYLRTIDGAGNRSAASTSVKGTPSALSASLTTRRDNQSVEYVKHNDLVEVRCSFGETVSGARIRFRTYTGTSASSIDTLGTTKNSVSSITENITINSNNYDRISFWCEVDGTSVTSQRNIYVDDILPEISWPSDFNTIFTGQRSVTITVTDNKGIDKVEFELNGVTHSTSRSGNNYSTTINTTNIENGNKTLKAIATDLAGNKAESSRTITISNTLTPMQEAEELISEAKIQRQVITDLLNYLKNSGILISEEIENEKARADELLTESEDESNPETKKEKATAAKLIYEELIKNTQVEDIESKKMSFSEEEIITGLIENNINQELIEQIKERIINSNVERELNIMQVGDELVAQIVITLNFDTNEEAFKVIEIIPKEFAQSASLLNSNLEFNIIEDNPVIEFIVPRNTTQISYTINNLSEEDIIRFSEEDILEKFSAPPILLEENEDTKEVLGQPFNWMLIMGGILIVLIIIGIIIAGIFFLSKEKNGFSSSSDKGTIEKIREILPKNSKEKTGPGKWKHEK